MKISWVVGILVLIVVILGGWYWYSFPGQSATAPSDALGVQGSNGQTDTEETGFAPLLSVASDAKLGNYLVASNGMTLYEYTKDTPGVSNCSGTCAVNWPPYVVSTLESLVVAENASGTPATVARADGSAQLTYNGKPLYFWKNDIKPGDTTGQNVGGVWFVVKP